MLALIEYCEKYVGFDESSNCIIVMGIRLVDCRWLKIKEMELDGCICLIWAL